MTFGIGLFVVGFITGLVVGVLVVYSLLKDEPKPPPAQLTPEQSRSLTRIRSDLMGLHAQLSEPQTTENNEMGCPGYSDEFADRRCGRHHWTELGNAFGSYDCCCGRPWLSDGCAAMDAQLSEDDDTLPSLNGL